MNGRDNTNTLWSLRQTAIYHQYRTTSSSSTWLIISPSEKIEKCLDRYTKSCTSLLQLNPFEIHIIVLDAALENWRPYIVSLTESVTQQVCSYDYSYHIGV